jgi:hypothetical protein
MPAVYDGLFKESEEERNSRCYRKKGIQEEKHLFSLSA